MLVSSRHLCTASSTAAFCMNAVTLICGVKPFGIVPLFKFVCSSVRWWLAVAYFFRCEVKSPSALVMLASMLVVALKLPATLFGVPQRRSSSSNWIDELVVSVLGVVEFLVIAALGEFILLPQVLGSVRANVTGVVSSCEINSRIPS